MVGRVEREGEGSSAPTMERELFSVGSKYPAELVLYQNHCLLLGVIPKDYHLCL